MLILPAIDILGGECVRLLHGDFGQKTTYNADPVAVAREFAAAGATWIHVVDLDAAKTGEPVNLAIVEQIARETGISVELGGGIRSLHSAQTALNAGVERVIVGTRLAQDEELAKTLFFELGSKVVAGVDTKGGLVSIHGWQEELNLDGLEFAQSLENLGCRRVIFTPIERDGALEGPNIEETKRWVDGLRIPVIASGGVSSSADLIALRQIGVEGAIVGKAIYEGRIDLESALAETAMGRG